MSKIKVNKVKKLNTYGFLAKCGCGKKNKKQILKNKKNLRVVCALQIEITNTAIFNIFFFFLIFKICSNRFDLYN